MSCDCGIVDASGTLAATVEGALGVKSDIFKASVGV